VDLLFATRILLKLLTNIHERPADQAIRSVRRSNPTIAKLLGLPLAAAVLGAVGFEAVVDAQGAGAHERSELLTLTAGRTVDLATLLALGRLDRCLKGLEGIAQPGEGADAAQATGDGRSHTCSACGCGIQNDVRVGRRHGAVEGWRGHEWNAQGEFRYHCDACSTDLCAGCYDRWKGGDEATHPLAHALQVVPPIKTPWGANGYGAAPAPPPLSARPRRGAFG
jgi:hypothetical protein